MSRISHLGDKTIKKHKAKISQSPDGDYLSEMGGGWDGAYDRDF